MPALQIKDCPENVYSALRACASRENRSISQQALTIIEAYLGLREHATPAQQIDALFAGIACDPDPSYPGKRKALFSKIEKLSPIPITQDVPDSADFLKMICEEEAR